MPESVLPLPHPLPASPAARPRTRSRCSGHKRVRWAMYLAFVALATAVGVQAWTSLRLDDLRVADLEILQQAALQRRFTQQMGSAAALLLAQPQARQGHMERMAQLMERSIRDTLVMEQLLARQLSRSATTSRSVGPALEVWQAARERLWYRSELLQSLRDDDGGLDPLVRERAGAVIAETEPALNAAIQLSSALRAAADLRAQGAREAVGLGAFAVLGMMGLLALLVVEPTARAVRRDARRLAEQATELQRLAMVAEHTSALVLISDAEDRVAWANPVFCTVAGWTVAEATGHRPDELLANPRADEATVARAQRALKEGRGVRLEWLHQARDGRDLWLDVDLCPLRDEQGRLSGFVRLCSDVTARVQQQAKLQTVWAALPAGVMVQAVDGRVVDANHAAERLLGLSLAEMQRRDQRGEGWRILDEEGRDLPEAERPVMRTLAAGLPLQNQTIGVRTPAGELRWLQCNTEPQRDMQGQVTGVVTCFGDVTEQRALQERISASARTDALTRLPNRAVVMERLQHAVEHARRHPGYGFAVLFMDFDRFKQVNDTLGHSAGDELLRQIAQRLQRTLRPGDAVARMESVNQVAARLGGDEFVIVLEGVHDVQAVGVVATRLLQELAEPYLIGATPVQSTASIGIVLCDQTVCAGEEPAETFAGEVLRNADTAMYEAKRAGRGRWVLFDGSMHERLVRALEVERDLRQALKGDELFVVYQPLVDLASRRMVGVEALVRWNHPTRGAVGPAEFVPVAEDCGLIDAVGAVVLRKACTQFMRWQAMPELAAPALLAVNLSRAQIGSVALVEQVGGVLQACGMRPEQLQLEVTESLAAQDERVQHTLRELKTLGARLALDDFGTGYSSLACLHQMPVDTVKIDRSFVKHAETVEYHRVLIEATIRVARTLGMTTVAEGIETEGQAELMLALQCDRGQGYLFDRPLDADAIEERARAQFEAEHADPA